MSRSPVATDNFNRATLGTNWTQLNPAFGNIRTVSSVQVQGSGSGSGNDNAARWTGAGTFTDDQYAKILFASSGFFGTGFTIGVIARASADTDALRDFYFYRIQDDASGTAVRTTELGKVVNGTETIFNTTTLSWTAGTDTVEIEVTGQSPNIVIKGLKNGVTQVTQSADSALNTGLPGVISAGDPTATTITGDDWEGGNLTTATSFDMNSRAMFILP